MCLCFLGVRTLTYHPTCGFLGVPDLNRPHRTLTRDARDHRAAFGVWQSVQIAILFRVVCVAHEAPVSVWWDTFTR
jgi:hypothetical protein